MSKESKTLALKHEGIWKRAKEIFGDKMVRNAWVTDIFYDPDPADTASVFRRHANVDIGADPNLLPLETNGCIMLEFYNGAKVVFSTSEWGSIEKIEDTDIIEL